MHPKKLMVIVDSIGFSLRSMRSQKDYLDYLINDQKQDITVVVLADSAFKEVAIETFSRTGAKVYFEDYNDSISNDEMINKIANKYNILIYNIVTERHAVDFLRHNLGDNYPTVKDNEGMAHPVPNKSCLFASEKTIEKVTKKLFYVAQLARDNTNCQEAKVIFLPFSGLKTFGTDYGTNDSEKQKISEYMSFPFEDSIPAIGKIQKEFKEHNIIVIPIIIQYGNLEEIHRKVIEISKQHNLNPLPTSLDIDWNRDFASQVGFFNAINQWSEKTGLPNIAIVHGSSSLHLVEECADPQRIIAFYATHTEKLNIEDDGRIYHLAVAEASGGWLRAVQPLTPYSHNYKQVAQQITEQALLLIQSWIDG
jgi:hypothetical protein